MSECTHGRVTSEVCDQTLGVSCLDCGDLLAYCWMENHVPESLWNRACENDSEAIPTEQSRDNFCALCGLEMNDEKADAAFAAMDRSSDEARDRAMSSIQREWDETMAALLAYEGE